MNPSQVTTHMFNPFDGALFASGTALSIVIGLVSGNSPVAATAVGALITGLFLLIAKGIELYVKARMDKRIARLKERAERAERDIVKLLEANQNLIARR